MGRPRKSKIKNAKLVSIVMLTTLFITFTFGIFGGLKESSALILGLIFWVFGIWSINLLYKISKEEDNDQKKLVSYGMIVVLISVIINGMGNNPEAYYAYTGLGIFIFFITGSVMLYKHK